MSEGLKADQAGPTDAAASKPGIWQTLKEEAIKHIAKTVITGAALVFIAGGSLTWAALKHWAMLPGIPPGAIIAFDVETPLAQQDKACEDIPGGWSVVRETRGRFIIGAGHSDESWKRYKIDKMTDTLQPFSDRNPTDKGGEENHILTIPEMPSHNHGGVGVQNGETAGMQQANPPAIPPHPSGTQPLPYDGGSLQHNIMPPFVAFYYCKKNR